MRLFLSLVPIGAACFGLACGGTAVVETSETTEGPSPLCATDPPVGQATLCEATGNDVLCSIVSCDDNGNRWEAECDSEGCVCSFNAQVRCSCAFDVGSAACGSGASCCPSPWR